MSSDLLTGTLFNGEFNYVFGELGLDFAVGDVTIMPFVAYSWAIDDSIDDEFWYGLRTEWSIPVL